MILLQVTIRYSSYIITNDTYGEEFKLNRLKFKVMFTLKVNIIYPHAPRGNGYRGHHVIGQENSMDHKHIPSDALRPLPVYKSPPTLPSAEHWKQGGAIPRVKVND